LLMVFSDTPYLTERAWWDKLLLLISQRNRTFVVELE